MERNVLEFHPRYLLLIMLMWKILTMLYMGSTYIKWKRRVVNYETPHLPPPLPPPVFADVGFT